MPLRKSYSSRVRYLPGVRSSNHVDRNHNFLPHNGYATIAQFLDATMNVVGMGPGLAGFLAVYGAVIDGDGGSWSIGGTPPDEYLPSPPINGQKGNGISGSHNK